LKKPKKSFFSASYLHKSSRDSLTAFTVQRWRVSLALAGLLWPSSDELYLVDVAKTETGGNQEPAPVVLRQARSRDI
jgi:hypothetical protein